MIIPIDVQKPFDVIQYLPFLTNKHKLLVNEMQEATALMIESTSEEPLAMSLTYWWKKSILTKVMTG